MKSKWFRISKESRSWEDFYRNRWSYDYSVRSSHGVNCSMACSWEVFVKDGLICWELQKTDWPQIEPDVSLAAWVATFAGLVSNLARGLKT